MSGDLASLGDAFRAAMTSIEEAQSSASLTRDRGDEALRLIGTVADGSDNVLITNAIERVAAADEALEEIIGMYVAANDQIFTYLGARGL